MGKMGKPKRHAFTHLDLHDAHPIKKKRIFAEFIEGEVALPRANITVDGRPTKRIEKTIDENHPIARNGALETETAMEEMEARRNVKKTVVAAFAILFWQNLLKDRILVFFSLRMIRLLKTPLAYFGFDEENRPRARH